MIIGQAAGVAASLAIRGGIAVQDVPVPELQQRLHAQHAVLNLADGEANAKAPQPNNY